MNNAKLINYIKKFSLYLKKNNIESDEINFYLKELLKSCKNNIQENKIIKKRVYKLSYYDSLTGLMKKELLIKKIEKLIKKANKHLIITLNIQDFRRINHAFSHHFGDKLLVELSNRLREDFKGYYISRVGIDEFIIFINDFENYLGEGVLIFLSDRYKIFEIEDRVVNINLYVGVNIIDSNYMIENLFKECDLSIDLAKKSPKNIAFFDKSLEEKVLKDFQLLTDIRNAIQKDELKLFYQLQYDIDNKIYGAEALIRWIHPKKGLIPPMEFIFVVEKNNLIIDVGDFILEEAFKTLTKWQQNPKSQNWILAVNINAKQFDDTLVYKLKLLQEKYNIDTSKLKLELLESIFFENVNRNIELMKEIKEMGFKIALDDFGTGFSSLQYLKDFPVDQIKIDKSFVLSMFDNEKNLVIIKTILDLGKGLGIEVVAEGVATRKHFEKLKELGCKLFQGYYFAKPEPFEKLPL